MIVGGHHTTLLPEDFFINDIDLNIRGPGHTIISNIMKKILANSNKYSDIKGVISNNGQLELTECGGWAENVNSPLPIPLKITTTKRYRWINGVHTKVIATAQGCSGRCSFCSCWPAMAGKYIEKKPIQVYREIASTKAKQI